MAFMDEFILPLAFALDLSLGDPRGMFHPVKGIGWLAQRTETWLRSSTLSLRLAGVVAVIVVVGGSAFSAWLLITLLSQVHRVAGLAMSIYLLYSSIALRAGLGTAAR